MIDIIRRIRLEDYQPTASVEEFWHELMRRRQIDFEYLLQDRLGRGTNSVEETELDDFLRYHEDDIRKALKMYKEDNEDRDIVKTSPQYRDINWSVNFEITVDGKSVRFWDLKDTEKRFILDKIESDYYSGTFTGEEE